MRKRSYSMTFAAVFLLVFIFTSSVSAESKQIYEVGTDNLHVRIAPDFNAEIVGKLKSGDRVTAFKEQHGWILTYYDGKEVWVASQYLFESEEVVHTQTENATATIKVMKDSVHLRDGPSTSHSILGQASKGDTYDLVATSDDWHKVRLDDHTTGWVASWLTNKPTEGNTTSGNHSSTSKKSTTSSPSRSGQSLAGYNIMLDPGHGGKDPGALGINNAAKEKDLILDFTNTVAQKLRNEGATVLLTRSTDSYVSLEERVRISEAYWTDAFISLHFNAFTTSDSNGVSTHYDKNGADYELAQHIQTALEKHTTLRSRGVKKDPYHVLRENNDVAVLVELGFITNPHDLEVIQSSSYSSEVANAIAEGLSGYFNQ